MKNFKYILCSVVFAMCSLVTNATNPGLVVSIDPLTPTPINTCGKVTYVISWNFTGNTTAHTITIKDVIDSKFNISSINSPGFLPPTIIGNTITFLKNIPANSGSLSGVIKITVEAKQIPWSATKGTYKHCSTANTARIFLDNNTVATQALSFSPVVINATNQWTVSKVLVGMVSTNTFRYKISIYSPECGSYNLYNPTLMEAPSDGGQVYSFNGTLNTPPSNTSFNLSSPLTVGNNYTYYLDVKYPCSLPNGKIVKNCASVKGLSPSNCAILGPNRTLDTIKAPVCPEATISNYSFAAGNNRLSKVHRTDRNHSRGCEDEYTITYQNNSTGVISNLVVCDHFPGNYLDLQTCASNPNNSITVAINSANQPSILTRIGSCSTTDPLLTASPCGSLPTITNLSWVFPTLQPNDVITIKIRFRIKNNAPIFQVVSNQVNVKAKAYAAYYNDLCHPGNTYPPIDIDSTVTDNFTVDTAAPRPTINKQVLNGPIFTPYAPTNIVKFRVCVSNYGGGAFSGTFSDFIDPQVFAVTSINDFNLTAHLDGEEQEQCTQGAYNGGSTALPLSAFTFDTVNHLLKSGVITIPGICKLDKFANLIIDFEAKLKPNAWLCHYLNTAKFNITAPSPVNTINATADYYVQDGSLLSFDKVVDGDGDGIYNTTENTFPGQIVNYKITLKNLGTVNLKNVQFFDNLPYVNDHSIQNLSASRNSTATLTPVSGSNLNSAGGTCLSCATTIPSPNSTQRFNDGITPTLAGTSGSSYYSHTSPIGFLAPNETIVLTYSALVPLTATLPSTAVNDVLVTADMGYDLANQPTTCQNLPTTPISLMPTNSNLCSLNILNGIACCVGKTAQINLVHDSVSYGADATFWQPTLNFSYSGLLVKKITVSVVNSWITYDNLDCAKEHSDWNTLSTLFKISPFTSSNFGNLVLNPLAGSYAPSFSWYSDLFLREVIYDNTSPGATTNFNTPYPITLGIFLPAVKHIKCCEGHARIVIKFSVEDVNCNVCDYFYTKDNIDILPY